MNTAIVLTYVLIAMSPSSEVTKVAEYSTNAKCESGKREFLRKSAVPNSKYAATAFCVTGEKLKSFK